MKKLLLALTFLTPFILFAQRQLKGTVTDSAGHRLDAVTILINGQNGASSSVFADSGIFILSNMSAETYSITASLIGYKKLTRTVQLPIDTLQLVMQRDSRTLGEVTISSSKPVFERKTDRITFNVENSIIANGGTAWDALSKAPGVQSQGDGTISANQKSVVVYMNGKPLHLTGNDLAGYLQGLPSDMVANIEVFSNPPAQFDAQGAAVINIITKKSKKQGLNVSLNGSYSKATYSSYTAGSVFNYRNGKLNIYGSYSFNDRNTIRDQTNYVTYQSPGIYSFWNSIGRTDYKPKTNNYQLGTDYQLSKNQVVGFLLTGSNRVLESIGSTNTTVNNKHILRPDSILKTNGLTDTRSNRYTFNLNYDIKLDTSGHSLNVDLDYLPYRTVAKQFVSNQTYLPDGTLASGNYNIFTPTTQDIHIYSAKADYSGALFKGWSFQSGLKYNSIKTSNLFNFYNNKNAVPVLVPANSNNFNYLENTTAVYGSVNGTAGKWTISGGLRGEFTHTKGHSVSLNSVTKKNYFDLFPSLFIQFKINNDNLLQLNYTNRLDRPEYSRLNPFKYYITPYNFLTGNPELQPAFTHNIEFGYTYRKDYNVTAYYTVTHDVFTGITVQNNVSEVFYNTQQNLGLSTVLGLRLSAAVHPADWWDMNYTANPHYRREASFYLEGSYDYRKMRIDLTTDQVFTIAQKAGLKAELNADYESPDIQGIYHGGSLFDLDAGLKTNILNGRGSLKLAAQDILYSYKYHVQVNYLNQDNGFYQKNDSRKINLSFSYRVGTGVANSRKRSTGTEEKKQRPQ
jgi:hypothetical protein